MAMRVDERFVYDLVESWGGMNEVDDAVAAIIEYREKEWYASKQATVDQWEIDHMGIYELVIGVFTAALCNEYLTYQALVGMLNHKIKLEDELDRVKIIADIIGLVINTGLVDMYSEQGEMHTITTDYEVDQAIPMDDKHLTITTRPQPVEYNWDREGGTGSVILGHRMNHHEHEVRLSHLQRMGQIPFCINEALVNRYEEAPKNSPETKEDQIMWDLFQAKSLVKYEELLEGKNRFFIWHKYDCRGRSYSGSYYVNPQGSSYKKAVVQLFNKEVVEGN